jgi:nitroimidazol reductase NimA-like FMN-containing flavoprotein (pyridoxamine 5'-phosphate oxidase superfamily)
MHLVDPRTGIDALDRKACLELLRTVPLGRVVMVVGGSPHIVPVNFAVDGEAVVFRTDEGTKLRAAERGRVAFEADHYDPATQAGWSVVIHGEAEELADPPAGVDVDPWAGGEKAHWIRIGATSITGRRVG